MEQRIKVTNVTPIENVKRKNGEAILKCVVVGTYMSGQYEKTIAFDCLGDKTNGAKTLSPGVEVTVSFNLESREYNGRYYTSVSVYKFDDIGIAAETKTSPAKSSPSKVYADVPPIDKTDDLPF